MTSIASRWVIKEHIDEHSILDQLMAWCRQCHNQTYHTCPIVNQVHDADGVTLPQMSWSYTLSYIADVIIVDGLVLTVYLVIIRHGTNPIDHE